MLRGNLNGMFVNLSRRSQSLIERQLSLIDNLEQTEQDADPPSSLFRVAAHPARQVVTGDKAGQPVGVLLRLLKVVDQGELALDERLAAARQVDEHRVQVAAQHGLVGGQPHRFPVYLVEG